MSERSQQIASNRKAQGWPTGQVDEAMVASFTTGIDEATPEQRTQMAERMYKAAAANQKIGGANVETILAAADVVLAL